MSLVFMASFLYSSAPVAACLCGYQSPAEYFRSAQAVFIGRARSTVRETRDGSEGYRTTFVVIRSWKGIPAPVVEIWSHRTNCLSWFEVGQDYLVLAAAAADVSALETSVCYGSRPVRPADALVRYIARRKSRVWEQSVPLAATAN